MSSKNAMKMLLELPTEDLATFKPKNGFEKVAHTYLTTALAEGDGAMLRYVMELSEEAPVEGTKKAESSLSKTLANLKELVEDG